METLCKDHVQHSVDRDIQALKNGHQEEIENLRIKYETQLENQQKRLNLQIDEIDKCNETIGLLTTELKLKLDCCKADQEEIEELRTTFQDQLKSETCKANQYLYDRLNEKDLFYTKLVQGEKCKSVKISNQLRMLEETSKAKFDELNAKYQTQCAEALYFTAQFDATNKASNTSSKTAQETNLKNQAKKKNKIKILMANKQKKLLLVKAEQNFNHFKTECSSTACNTTIKESVFIICFSIL